MPAESQRSKNKRNREDKAADRAKQAKAKEEEDRIAAAEKAEKDRIAALLRDNPEVNDQVKLALDPDGPMAGESVKTILKYIKSNQQCRLLQDQE